jgi:hypothetical protein
MSSHLLDLLIYSGYDAWMETQVIPSDLNYSQSERLRFIDFRVYFMGDLGRNHLTTRFGMGPAGATRDIALYRQIAPRNLDFDTVTKTYRRSDDFTPLFSHNSSSALALLAGGDVGLNEPLLRCESPGTLDVICTPVLAAITRAINLGHAIDIEYCSVSSGFGRREVVPFALVDTGLRWHFRAFDRKSKGFRDFVLSRVSKVDKPTDVSVADHERADQDLQWTRQIELRLIPHPFHPRPEAIEMEFGANKGGLQMRARAATVGYLLRRWNVDCSPNRSLKGLEYMLCLEDPLSLYGAETAVLAPGYRLPESF